MPLVSIIRRFQRRKSLARRSRVSLSNAGFVEARLQEKTGGKVRITIKPQGLRKIEVIMPNGKKYYFKNGNNGIVIDPERTNNESINWKIASKLIRTITEEIN